MVAPSSLQHCVRQWLKTEYRSPLELVALRRVNRHLRDTISPCLSSSSAPILQQMTSYKRIYLLELTDLPLIEQLLGRIEATGVQILILKGETPQTLLSVSAIPRLHRVRSLVLDPTNHIRGINNPELPWHTLTSLTALELSKCTLTGSSLTSLTRLVSLKLQVYAVEQIPSVGTLHSLDIKIISRPPASLALIRGSLTQLTQLQHLGLSHWSDNHLLPPNLAPLLADK
ncbi:MAG: hypothetical protein S4CHLAM2_00940 [Chlamydiales bacterium]|nr:hypothetical protein [Chlamydiales bacterium]